LAAIVSVPDQTSQPERTVHVNVRVIAETIPVSGRSRNAPVRDIVPLTSEPTCCNDMLVLTLFGNAATPGHSPVTATAGSLGPADLHPNWLAIRAPSIRAIPV
jgi:hypothetical protein